MASLVLEMSDGMNRVVNRLAKRMNCSRAEVLLRSLALLHWATSARDATDECGAEPGPPPNPETV